jgi:hypothetical protein
MTSPGGRLGNDSLNDAGPEIDRAAHLKVRGSIVPRVQRGGDSRSVLRGCNPAIGNCD